MVYLAAAGAPAPGYLRPDSYGTEEPIAGNPHDGFCALPRQAGTFAYPFNETGRKEIAAWELGVLLEGIDLRRGRRRKRYCLPETALSS
jgi:hypothetical protein